MADKQSLIQKLNPRLRNPVLKVESIVTFRECCLSDSWASAWDRGGRGTLGAWRVTGVVLLPAAPLLWVPLAAGAA